MMATDVAITLWQQTKVALQDECKSNSLIAKILLKFPRIWGRKQGERREGKYHSCEKEESKNTMSVNIPFHSQSFSHFEGSKIDIKVQYYIKGHGLHLMHIEN